MALSNSRFLILGVAFALSGCSFASEALFPSLDGEQSTQSVAISPSGGETSGSPTISGGPPVLGSSEFVPGTVAPGQPTGTFVGAKAQTFWGELGQLQGTIRNRNDALQTIRGKTQQDSKGYHELMAEMNSRLQVGTTPGNPVLQTQWSQAQTQLDLMSQDIASMNELATQVASDGAMAAYLLDSVRAAFGLSGAVDEDHRQLRILEDQTNQSMVLIERLLNELSQDISRQQSYVANERSNLNTLSLAIKNGQMYGPALSNQAMVRTSVEPMRGGMGTPSISNRRPLVVIRFDRPNVAYEQPLYQAVSRAIDRRPDAAFDVVAVSPAQGTAGQQALNANAARRSAQQVVRSLTDMGLPADRIRVSAVANPQSTTNEVHLYVR